MVNRMGEGSAIQPTQSKQGVNGADKDVAVPQIGGDKSAPNQLELELPLPADKAKKMTDSLNKFLETSNTELRFKFHDELKEYYVTVVNSKDEVVREIPSKKLMDIFAAMQDFLGILVDRKI